MVVRVAGYGYQKGFGGHFHNDNSIAAIRDIPGVVIASPARPDDAAAMLHTCAAAAKASGAVCVFLEPIALYHTRDLHEDGDEQWLATYPAAGVPIGRARTYGDGTDLTILTFANGLRMSLRVARRLESCGIGARVVDLRWLAPLPVEDMLREADITGKTLDRRRNPRRPAEWAKASSPPCSNTATPAPSTGSPARTASSRSATPRCEVLLSEETIEAAAIKLAGRAPELTRGA